MVNNLPANAGHTGLIPDPGGFYMLQGNSARVLQLLKPVSFRAHALQREAIAMRSLLATTRESLRAATKIQCSQK